MSGGLHRLWKRFAVDLAGVRPGQRVLDLAGGTGDLARLFAGKVGPPGRVVHSDINHAMLAAGRDKLLDRGVACPPCSATPKRCRSRTAVRRACRSPSACATSRARRSRSPRCAACSARAAPRSCSSSPASRRRSRPLYDWYSFNVLPRLGKLVANDEASYRYLAESIRVHPDQDVAGADDGTGGFRPGRIPEPHRGRRRYARRPRLLIAAGEGAILQASAVRRIECMNRLFAVAAAARGADRLPGCRRRRRQAPGRRPQLRLAAPDDAHPRAEPAERHAAARPPIPRPPRRVPRPPPPPAAARACRAGSARSRVSRRASASRRCCRTSACPRLREHPAARPAGRAAASLLVRMFLARRAAPAAPLQYAGAPADSRRAAASAARHARRSSPSSSGAAQPRVRRTAFRRDSMPPPFVEQAKLQFRQLQAAYDAADRKALADVMTPEMFAEVSQRPRPARDARSPPR